ncbi:unnamed protein product, partial [Allacma fusca]
STLGCRNNQVDWKGFQSRPRKIPLLSGTTTAAENVQLHLQLYNTSRGPSSGNHNICSCTVEYDSVEFNFMAEVNHRSKKIHKIYFIE